MAVGCVEQKFEILQKEIQESQLSDRAKGLYIQATLNLRDFVSYRKIFQIKKAQMQSVKDQVDLLFLAADSLPNYLVPEVNSVTIDVLSAEINSLMDLVRKSEVDVAFRSMLMTSLGTLLLSVQAYSTLGPDGAAKLYGTAAAEIARLGGTATGKKPENSGLAAKALTICKKAGSAIIFISAVVSGAHSAIEDGTSILGIEGQSSEANASDADS